MTAIKTLFINQKQKTTVQGVHRGQNNVPGWPYWPAGALREGKTTSATALMRIRMIRTVLLNIMKCASFP
jgi:hypothetical protein